MTGRGKGRGSSKSLFFSPFKAGGRPLELALLGKGQSLAETDQKASGGMAVQLCC